ncbi:hypothetical protein [Pseudomonas anguilliseptica]|uniref:Uncharacterized protein n=1 Tax=Pseudomonas anguilliseptica TaxID=53406 RepID=A0A1H4PQY6_PSEAG|nr:hypothetical protein [Pseudomonas anguilliseptica]SEC09721.1 hypothetical protein SAMN05421553_0320 [Pseudomonas anguilliseptica]
MTSSQSVKPIQSAEKLANAYGISSQALIEIFTVININLFIEAPVDNYDLFLSDMSERKISNTLPLNENVKSILKSAQYQVVTDLIEYLCLVPNDYKLIALKNGIRIDKFLFAGSYDVNSGIKIATPAEFARVHISTNPIFWFKYLYGYICARKKQQNKKEEIDMNAGSECSIRISFSDLLISPNDMELIIPQLPCRKPQLHPSQDPHISDSLHFINELHREILGIESSYERRSLNETKAYIKTRLKEYWIGDKSGLETKIREAAAAKTECNT